MVTKANRILVVLFTAVLLLGYCKSTAEEDPPEVAYFGGSDNEAYIDWLSDRSTRYDNSIFMQSLSTDDEGTAIHWFINGDTISIAVAARAVGWVGFGLSENGGMKGADVVMFSADNPNNLTDAHILDDPVVVEDACQSWVLTHSEISDGFIIFEAERFLDTGDTQDRVIIDDSVDGVDGHKVISAWGDEGGWEYHGENYARDTILFFDGGRQWDKFRAEMKRDAEGSFFVGADNFLIPNKETTYHFFCLDASGLEEQGVPLDKTLQIIGVEPIIDNRTTEFNHHFVAMGLSSTEIANCAGLGDGPSGGVAGGGAGALYSWAPGSGPSLFPADVGLALAEGGFNSFSLQVHYDNPGLVAGQYDSSGVRVYWTSNTREHGLSSFGLADVATRLNGTLVGQGYTRHEFRCPASCSERMLEGPVTVFQETLHMHEAGVRVTNEVIRNGTVVHSSLNDFYDFDQAGTILVQQEPYELQPGDSFVTTCYYENIDPDHKFGFASAEEMCIVALNFYPSLEEGIPICSYRLPIPGCWPTYTVTELDSVDDLGRTFGKPSDVCARPPGKSNDEGTDITDSATFSLPTSPPSDPPSQFLGDSSVADDVASKFFGGSDNEAYIDWLNQRSSRYDNSIFMQSLSTDDEGTAVHWSINGDTITIAVAARAVGWVGLGLSENGGMKGADVVMFSADNPNNLTDGHILDDPVVVEDACQSWVLIHSEVSDGFIIFEASRLLDTGDTQDRVIIDDSVDGVDGHKVISAWGDEGGWEYHGENRARDRILFFDGGRQWDAFWAEMDRDAEGSFFVGADNFLIPEEETTYQYFCLDASGLEAQGVPLDQPLQIIGVEPIIDNRSVEFIHHFVSMGSSFTATSDCGGVGTGGRGGGGAGSNTLYNWAPGSGPSLYPTGVGAALGEGGFKSFSLQVHYDNPRLVAGQYDSSGLRVHWTSNTREHGMSGFGLADVATRLNGTLVGEGYTKHEFICPASCTRRLLTEPIIVYQETLHMHEVGVRATNEVIRNGTVVHSSLNDFYDFDQAGTIVVQQTPYEIQPGDSFVSTCYYNSSDPDHKFGFASAEEMCIVGLNFYPSLGRGIPICSYELPIPGCRPTYTVTQLDSVDDLGRTFGQPSEFCAKPVIDVEDSSSSSSQANETEDSSGVVPGSLSSLVPSGNPTPATSYAPSDPLRNVQSDDPFTFFGGSDNEGYVTWLNERSTRFDNSMFMQSLFTDNEGTAIHWTIDRDSITIAVAARAMGWVGFGLSENGGMKGSDVVMFSADNPKRLMDGHILDDPAVIEDACQSWELIYSEVSDDGFIIFEASRLLDTGDTQDRVIIDDSVDGVDGHKIISAWGDEGSWQFHGENRVRDTVLFLGNGGRQWDTFWSDMDRDAEGTFFVGADQFLIPNQETTYHYFCLDALGLAEQGVPLDQPLQIIGVEPMIDSRTAEYNHHFVLMGFTSAVVSSCSDPSTGVTAGSGTGGGIGTLYSWAPGSGPYLYPSNVGVALGEGGYNSFSIQIHYNNPRLHNDQIDSSGVKLYWTRNAREYIASGFGLADVRTRLEGSNVGEGYTKHIFTCPASCTRRMLTEPIIVYQETLHMHETGIRATNEVIRNDTVVHIGMNDFYDFEQAGTVVIQQEPFEIHPGDSFVTTCFYDSSVPNHKFGFASAEEMCIASLNFYPPLDDGRLPLCSYDIPIPGCEVEYSVIQLNDINDLGRTFGQPAQVCGLRNSNSNNNTTQKGDDDKGNNTTSANNNSNSTITTNDEDEDDLSNSPPSSSKSTNNNPREMKDV